LTWRICTVTPGRNLGLRPRGVTFNLFQLPVGLGLSSVVYKDRTHLVDRARSTVN